MCESFERRKSVITAYSELQLINAYKAQKTSSIIERLKCENCGKNIIKKRLLQNMYECCTKERENVDNETVKVNSEAAIVDL